MVKVTVHTGQTKKQQQFPRGTLLYDALARMGFAPDRPCGGRGVCGKCAVRADGKSVLSCQTAVQTDIQVEYSTPAQPAQGVTEGFLPPFDRDPLIQKGYGLAVDLGTTTIAGYLYRFPQCDLVRRQAVPNPQTRFGADVVSRIEHALRGAGQELAAMAAGQIRLLSGGLPVDAYVITGNTAMLHLLTGRSPRGLAAAPFAPETLFGDWHGPAYLPRCVSAFVGADITTAILASGMLENQTALLADIGTNGEMALWHEGRLLCCSVAAGPAFEGAGIRDGMTASPGAIDRVRVQGGRLQADTVANLPPAGLCGTGLIDAVACMLDLGAVEADGFLDEPFPLGEGPVCVTPQDIRQVQLAKSAVRAGIDTLLFTAGLQYRQVERFYIAGGFGSFIRPLSAARIGMIPWELVPKAQALGNSAGAGAAMILQSRECLARSEQIAKMAQTVELATDSTFQRAFLDHIAFDA